LIGSFIKGRFRPKGLLQFYTIVLGFIHRHCPRAIWSGIFCCDQEETHFTKAGLDFSRHKKEGIDPGKVDQKDVCIISQAQILCQNRLPKPETHKQIHAAGILGRKLANSSLVGQRAPNWVTFAGRSQRNVDECGARMCQIQIMEKPLRNHETPGDCFRMFYVAA
jgi:hypothetical protein